MTTVLKLGAVDYHMVDRQIRFKPIIPATDGNARLRIQVTNRCIDLQVIQTDSQIHCPCWQEDDLCLHKAIRMISYRREETSTEREETQQNVNERDPTNKRRERKGTRLYLN